MLSKGDRIRPRFAKTYRIRTGDFTVEFSLNHQQLWEVSEASADQVVLRNSGSTMRLILSEAPLGEMFDVDRVKRGKYYNDPSEKAQRGQAPR